MVLLARLLARLTGIVIAAVLALVAIATAIFCIQGGHGTLSLPSLAADVHLPALRDAVGTLLDRLHAHGSVAVVSALCGLGAIVLGVALLIGALVPARERAITLIEDDDGAVGARRRALAQVAAALAERPAVVLRARVRARPWRRRFGGRLRVRAEHLDGSSPDEVQRAVSGALDELTGSLPLEARVRVRHRERKGR